jgi:hypothetical protein
MARRLKLRIDLVPYPLFGRNLRSAKEGIGAGRWKALRRRSIEACGGRCAICGGTDKLHGHEVWKYEDKKRVGLATIIKVDVLCRTCHNISHWGNTSRLIVIGAIQHETYLLLRRHFRRINRCLQADFERHIRWSYAQWRRRSAKKWKIDWGPYAPLIAESTASRARWRAQNAHRLIANAAGGAENARTGHLLNYGSYSVSAD